MSSRKKRAVESESESQQDSSSSDDRASSSSEENDSDGSGQKSSKKRSRSKSTKSTKSTKKSASTKRRKSTSSRKSRSSWMANPTAMETTGFDALLQLASASTALDEARAVANALPSVPAKNKTKPRDTAKTDRSNEKKRKTSRKPRVEREGDNEPHPVVQQAVAVRKPATSPERHFVVSTQAMQHPMMMMQGVPQMSSFGSHGQYVQSINDMGQMTFVNPNVNESMITMNPNGSFVSQGQNQYGVTIHPNGQQYTLVGLNHMGQFNHNPQMLQQRHFVQPQQFTQQQSPSIIHDQSTKQPNHASDSSIANPPNISLFPSNVIGRPNFGATLSVGPIVPQPAKGPMPVDRKLCSRHVAIAYHIFNQQRSNVATSNHAPHDPTLEARRLKERTEWARRGIIGHPENPSVALVPAVHQSVGNTTTNLNDSMLQQQQLAQHQQLAQQQQLAMQLQLAASNPAMMQQMLQHQQLLRLGNQPISQLGLTNLSGLNAQTSSVMLNPIANVSQMSSTPLMLPSDNPIQAPQSAVVEPIVEPIESAPTSQNHVIESSDQPVVLQQSESAADKPTETAVAVVVDEQPAALNSSVSADEAAAVVQPVDSMADIPPVQPVA